jgi:A/G-specific adenine glycosylase
MRQISSKSSTPRQTDAAFQRQVLDYYHHHGRHTLPWRQAQANGSFDPYRILVSEAMLQQTQVSRVLPKFEAFIGRFPDAATLAQASLGEVLRTWNGLGYNRRAKFLHQAAKQLIHDHPAGFPQTTKELVSLPGVGPNTAGAIQVYAFNQPALFIETNIRTVFIHHFFTSQTAITDQAIMEVLARTLPTRDPRTWYWALMDYGSYLKQTVGNLNQASRSYTKQSTFAGSHRQLRGQIIRLLSERSYTIRELASELQDKRLPKVLQELQAEGLVQITGTQVFL